MSAPLLSIIIPTHNRPHLLPKAVQSALRQTLTDLEVIVVDDASAEPVQLPAHPQLRLIRLSSPRGGAGARNVGTEAARGRWITYLDDDDCLLPHMAQVSLEALQQSTLPPPVGVISGLEIITPQGKVIGINLPPNMRLQGCHFALEELEPSRSYNTKQTLVVEREIIRQIGGWDESFRSRVHTELFLRLNPVCSIIGLPIITYQLLNHEGVRVSLNSKLRQESFKQLINRHKDLFYAHPRRFAYFVYEHALKSYQLGQRQTAISSLGWAMRIDLLHTLALMASPIKRKLLAVTAKQAQPMTL